MTSHTPGPWRVGLGGHCVVADTPVSTMDTGHDAVAYYGGHLIAESIYRPEDVALISAATELLAELDWALPLLDLIPPDELLDRGIDAEVFERHQSAARAALLKANTLGAAERVS